MVHIYLFGIWPVMAFAGLVAVVSVVFALAGIDKHLKVK